MSLIMGNEGTNLINLGIECSVQSEIVFYKKEMKLQLNTIFLYLAKTASNSFLCCWQSCFFPWEKVFQEKVLSQYRFKNETITKLFKHYHEIRDRDEKSLGIIPTTFQKELGKDGKNVLFTAEVP